MNALPSRLLAILCAVAAPCCSADVKRGEMYGYLLFDGERVPREFNAGFSLYAAAWPLVDHSETLKGTRALANLVVDVGLVAV